MKLKTKKILFDLVLVSTLFSATGCAKTFDYKTGDNGEIVAEGYVNFDYIENCKLLEIRGTNNKSKLFVCEEKINDSDSLIWNSFIKLYTDIRTDKIIFDTGAKNELILVKVSSLKDYLITYDEIKEQYSIDDIDRILEKIEKDYEFSWKNPKSKRIKKW